MFWLSPWTWFRRRQGSRGERLRRALEDLGPLFVKFGQALSTRRDLLPADVADELAKLQDRVPPFPGAEARAMCERAYGRAVGEVFEAFDETPLAAASIAQVHAARLRGGQEVVAGNADVADAGQHVAIPGAAGDRKRGQKEGGRRGRAGRCPRGPGPRAAPDAASGGPRA